MIFTFAFALKVQLIIRKRFYLFLHNGTAAALSTRGAGRRVRGDFLSTEGRANNTSAANGTGHPTATIRTWDKLAAVPSGLNRADCAGSAAPLLAVL